MDDVEVIVLIKKGNEEKFGVIVDRYEKALFRYIKRLINQRDEEVEDLVAEVFLNTYENIQDFDINKKFSSWIYRIAHNKAVDYIKRKHLTTISLAQDDDLFEEKEKPIEERLIEREERDKVIAHLEKLELKYREVLLLYYFEEKNQEEISDILRTTINNVKVLLFRAKEKLRRRYE